MLKNTRAVSILVVSWLSLLSVALSVAGMAAGQNKEEVTGGSAAAVDLVYYWKFDEGSGTTAADSAGSNDGAIQGNAAWGLGQVNNALIFDGVDDWAAITQTFTFHQAGDASLLLWMKRADDAHRTMFWTRGDATDADRFHVYSGWLPGMSAGGTDYYGFGFDYRTPAGDLRAVLETTFPANEWTHIAVVRSGNDYLLYKNGQLVNQVTDNNPDLPAYTGNWFIGSRAGQAGFYYQGSLDEAALFNTALTAEQIQLYYRRGVDGLGYEGGYNDTADDFNNGLNPALWQTKIEGSGPAVTATNQRLEITLPANASDDPSLSRFRGEAQSVCKVRGDFDMLADYELLAWPANNGVRIGLRVTAPGVSDKTMERVSRGVGESGGEVYGGNFSTGNTPISATTDLSGTLRLRRVGGTYTAYYRDTANGQWVAVLSETGLPTANLYFGVAAWSHNVFFADQEVKVAFDNFRLYQGELLCGQMS
ncbi:MAG: LamG domain-containing protein, partial [Anaerolineae bacterium]